MGCCGQPVASAPASLGGGAWLGLEPLDGPGPPLGGAGAFGVVNPGAVAGGTLGALIAQALHDPYVEQKLREVQDQCQSRAKVGVTEFLAENWPWLLAGGAALIWTNYLMLVFGVVPLVRPRAPRTPRSDVGGGL